MQSTYLTVHQSWKMQRRVERNKMRLTVGVWSRSLMLQALFNLGPSVLQLIQNVGPETEQIRG